MPGKCSICGMDLTPVYKGDAKGNDGIVSIDPAMIQNIGVKTEAVMNRNLTRTIRTTGRVDYDETKITYITNKFSGYIEKLYVDYTGKLIQKGQPLFEIYSTELIGVQQEYLQAINSKNNFNGSADLVQSAKKKMSYWDISEAQINELEKSGNIKKSLTIYSPYSGYVIEKNVFEGMQVQAGTNLFKLVDISQMWVYADVYENELPLIKTDDNANIELPYNAGQSLSGKVSYIYPYLNEQTRTAQVRIAVSNPNDLLKKDMYVTVSITPSVSRNALH